MLEEVRYAMNPMKLGKENGSSVEFFKAGGNKCLKSFKNIFNDILFKDKLRQECMLSSLIPIFKGKVDPLNPNSYREIKLLQLAFKLCKMLLDESLRERVHIDKM